jgi:prepilin-type N-terminal cleavage/methylation domain-containing protein
MTKNKAFTLLELTVVLVIIGLLAGAVVSGQKLIANAKRAAIISEFTAIETAIESFRVEYGALPGDFDEAYDYWGSDCAGSAGACNGDGDGIYGGDYIKVMHHLSLAGLYPGSYDPTDVFGGVMAPSDYRLGTGYVVLGGATEWYGQVPEYFIEFAAWGTPSALNVLTPTDAQLIDMRMDDGVASTGRLVAASMSGSGCVAAVGSGTDTDPDYDAVAGEVDYDTSLTSVGCLLAKMSD